MYYKTYLSLLRRLDKYITYLLN